MMNDADQIHEMGNAIREIYQREPTYSAHEIEAYLANKLHAYPPESQQQFLHELLAKFPVSKPLQSAKASSLDNSALGLLLPLLLGEKAKGADLTSEDVMEKLANSLNTIFDSLNELIAGINETFMAKSSETETIRMMIRSDMTDTDVETRSLESYLDQIKEAFAVAHQAFQEAALAKISEIMLDLNPATISNAIEGGLQFGPFRKAEMFELYKEKHQIIQKWLDTGLLKDSLLREFEKQCQNLYSGKM